MLDDGTKNTIEVEEKWYDLLKEMDEAERKQKYNYERHNYPLSQVDYEGETFADYSADPFEKMVAEIDKERIAAALTTLTDCQRALFEKVFIERKKITSKYLLPKLHSTLNRCISLRLLFNVLTI